jgi:hypothetical protein
MFSRGLWVVCDDWRLSLVEKEGCVVMFWWLRLLVCFSGNVGDGGAAICEELLVGKREGAVA